jgi:phytanoyl-CoA dioxygenase PhyH
LAELLSEQQWADYERLGFLTLRSILSQPELAQLRQRMDEIMLGQISYPELQFQLDTGGAYEDLPDPVSQNSARTLAYRKVQGLEAVPMVRDLIRRPMFRDICDRHYGRHTSISIFRAMLMNKPAGQGTYLPWHQDAGDVWKLDRDPLVTIWIALDAATRMNGCVQVIPGSHRLGLLSHHGSTLSAEDARRHCPESAITYLEIEAGDGLLLHNWLLHRSDVNHTDSPRRALTSCYMDGRTRNTLTGDQFPIVFGEPEGPWPFLQSVSEENRILRESAAEAERYAKSLAEHAERLETMRSGAEQYARSLEVELNRVRTAAAPTGTLNRDCPD